MNALVSPRWFVTAMTTSPELVAAHQSMQEQVLLNAIDKALAAAPPLTPEMRSRIVGLLVDRKPAGR